MLGLLCFLPQWPVSDKLSNSSHASKIASLQMICTKCVNTAFLSYRLLVCVAYEFVKCIIIIDKVSFVKAAFFFF